MATTQAAKIPKISSYEGKFVSNTAGKIGYVAGGKLLSLTSADYVNKNRPTVSLRSDAINNWPTGGTYSNYLSTQHLAAGHGVAQATGVSGTAANAAGVSSASVAQQHPATPAAPKVGDYEGRYVSNTKTVYLIFNGKRYSTTAQQWAALQSPANGSAKVSLTDARVNNWPSGGNWMDYTKATQPNQGGTKPPANGNAPAANQGSTAQQASGGGDYAWYYLIAIVAAFVVAIVATHHHK